MTGSSGETLSDESSGKCDSPTSIGKRRNSKKIEHVPSVNLSRVDKLNSRSPHSVGGRLNAAPTSHIPDAQLPSLNHFNLLLHGGFPYTDPTIQGSLHPNLAGAPPLQPQGIPYPYTATPMLNQGNWMPVVLPTGQTVSAWVPGIPQVTPMHILHTGPMQVPPQPPPSQPTPSTPIPPQTTPAESRHTQPIPELSTLPDSETSQQAPIPQPLTPSLILQQQPSQPAPSNKLKDQATLDFEFQQHNLERIRLRNELRQAKSHADAVKAGKQRAKRRREKELQDRAKTERVGGRSQRRVSEEEDTEGNEHQQKRINAVARGGKMPSEEKFQVETENLEDSSDMHVMQSSNVNDAVTNLEKESKGPFLVGRVKKLRYGHGDLIPETQQRRTSITEKDKETALQLLQKSYKEYLHKNPAKPELPEIPLDSVSLLAKFDVSTENEAKMLAYKEIDVDNTAQRLEFNDLVDSLEMLGIQNIEGEWVCPLCPPGAPTYTLYKHLLRHATSHLNLQPFRCPFCFKKFRRSDTARRHQGRCFQLALAIDKRLGRLGLPHPRANDEQDVPQSSKRTPEPTKDDQVPALNDTNYDYTTETEPSEDELREIPSSMSSPSARGGEAKSMKSHVSIVERAFSRGSDRRNMEKLPPVVMPLRE